VDVIGVRDEFQKIAEGLGYGIAVQADANHVLLFDVHGAQNESLQILKELGLLNNDMGCRSELGALDKGHESLNGRGRVALAGVRHDGIIRIRIPSIKTACNTEGLDPDEGVTTENSHDGGGLSSEHGADIQFQGHLLWVFLSGKNGSIFDKR
jgi:hypothetical protein